jgi:hypothetical protein
MLEEVLISRCRKMKLTKQMLIAGLALLGANVNSWANEANQKLLAMLEEDRHAAFTEVVRQAGDCDRVVRSMLLNDEANDKALWSVGCQNLKSYAVTIYADSRIRPFV